MEQAPSVAEFVRSPLGRWCATRTTLGWVASPTLGGFATWGSATSEDVPLSTSLFEALHALPEPIDLVMDGRGIESVDFDAMGVLLAWIRSELERIRPRIKRRIGLIPTGPQGLTLAGISPVLGWTVGVTIATDLRAGLRELGAPDPEGLAAEVDALVARVREAPALLVELRSLLRVRGGDLGLADAARALKVSPRSLQRALAQGGTSYRAEELDARLDAALRLLEGNAKVSAVAARLGVTEGALVRLVRARTGMSPTEYRAAKRAKDA
jgi:AraC-like DNA-binding protein